MLSSKAVRVSKTGIEDVEERLKSKSQMQKYDHQVSHHANTSNHRHSNAEMRGPPFRLDAPSLQQVDAVVDVQDGGTGGHGGLDSLNHQS
jgi:hypothetical protein